MTVFDFSDYFSAFLALSTEEWGTSTAGGFITSQIKRSEILRCVYNSFKVQELAVPEMTYKYRQLNNWRSVTSMKELK